MMEKVKLRVEYGGLGAIVFFGTRMTIIQGNSGMLECWSAYCLDGVVCAFRVVEMRECKRRWSVNEGRWIGTTDERRVFVSVFGGFGRTSGNNSVTAV
jgi:hypothetical protein